MSLHLAPRSVRRRTVAFVVCGVLVAAASCSGGDADEPASESTGSSSTTALPAAPLAGTSWQLSSIERDGDVVDATSEVPAVVSFTDDQLEAYDGVNTATGSYDVDGGELAVDALVATEIAATGPALPQHELFALLERGGTLQTEATTDGLRLELDDATVLVFDRTAGGVDD